MRKELFGVFGDRETFGRFRSSMEFDRVVEGSQITVGIRDVGLGLPGRSTTHETEESTVAIWGEAYVSKPSTPGRWLAEAATRGPEALSALNGSYLAAVDTGRDAYVATDPARTWECFYTDAPGVRVFGTDPMAVARTVDSPTLATAPLTEFVHFGVVFGDRTLLEEVRRTPFDGLLRERGVETLDRFVYDPQPPEEFDYVAELTERLERAIRRRAHHPGRKGLMLSAGYDSRTLLACLPDVDVCYSLGPADGREIRTAARIAAQYDTPHELLEVDERYLNTAEESIRYGHGIKESLHIHHAGYDPQMNVDTMYHGLFCDTIVRGHFQPRDGFTVFGHKIPRERRVPDPDPIDAVVSKLGYMDASERLFPGCTSLPDDCDEFARAAVEAEYPEPGDRYESVSNGIDLFGIKNQPTTPFRMHLADQYLESFVAADRELVDWHLKTPPEHRRTRTFLKAIRQIDPAILRHRPPDRPYDSHPLNQIEGFVRRKLPGLRAFESAWPDRRTLYERASLDETLFGDDPTIHDLPPRIKLRINDAMTWVNAVVGEGALTPSNVVCPPRQWEPVVATASRSESDADPHRNPAADRRF